MKVCWFSTGVSSFVACYLAKDIDEIIYTHVENQHPDVYGSCTMARRFWEQKLRLYNQISIRMWMM